ncbi:MULTISPECIES: hypothetical protein [unclassified Mesorhizobium]|uniref:hypothetical protein n=1 Tax=unclassified Mesorhizobium TaxID=325217 RepID=UPI001AECEF72|nr:MULTISPECIES: hypothetical protein [unclassified Mesorhizobium]
MIIVSFLYPNTERARFDAAYYVEKHVPLALGLLGDAVRGIHRCRLTKRQALEVLIGLAAKLISNFTNALAHTELDDPVKPLAWVHPSER